MVKRNKSGRPAAITEHVVSLLVTSFHNGLTVKEACLQAGISRETYYSRLRSDADFSDKMEAAQMLITAKARKIVVQAIDEGDLRTAKWWLERKSKQELTSDSERQNQEASNLAIEEEVEQGLNILAKLKKMRESNRVY